MDQHYLNPLFNPRRVAVMARPDTLPQAERLLHNLKHQRYSGEFLFIDPHFTGTLDDLVQAHADLAVLAVPAAEVAGALEIAARMQCRAALLVSSDLDTETAGKLKAYAQREGIHLLGPNGLGLQRPHLGLNASVAGDLAQTGPLGLVSQSGAITAAVLDWAQSNGVGFSTVVSLGRNTALDVADVLDFLAADPKTQSIVVYLEGIAQARRFMSALRAAANAKPVVVLKAGRKTAGNQAAQTHSGAIVGSDEVFDAALRRAGAVRVHTFVELFSATKCLASRYRPVGGRLAILTNGGGPGILAADWIAELDLELGTLSATSAATLIPQLGAAANTQHLIDLGEDADAQAYEAAIAAAALEPGVDGLLVIHAPKTGVDSNAIAQVLVEQAPRLRKPLVASWMGDTAVREARQTLTQGNIPHFRAPEPAVEAFRNIAAFYYNQQMLHQTPPPLSSLAEPDVEGARLIIEGVLAERRQTLTEMESKALLSAFHIPVTQTILARSANEAMMIATQLGFPVALKIDSPDITHKSDVNGVALNVANASAVRSVYADMVQTVAARQPGARINGVTIQRMAPARRGRELYVGVVSDAPFGPVIVCGAGGTMIELINDRSMELPPLNQFLARHMIERSRVAKTLQAWRGLPEANLAAVEQVLLRVSEMVCELPQLREMDINPIIVDDQGAVAVDARIVVQPAASSASRYNHLAILPYPTQHEQVWPMRGGGEYTIRPIHPDDATMLQELVRSLSPESRYFRFVSTLTELPPDMLSRFTLIDYDREMALVAVHQTRKARPDGSFEVKERVIGVSRYVTNVDSTSCEFALVVADAFGGQGIGSRLMLSIMDVARDRGLSQIEGLILTNNPGMLRLMRSLGFTIKAYPDDPDFRLAVHRL